MQHLKYGWGVSKINKKEKKVEKEDFSSINGAGSGVGSGDADGSAGFHPDSDWNDNHGLHC